MLIALTIIVILATITVPRLITHPGNIITAELRTIETIIQFLQQKALASNHEQYLIIDTQHHTYTYQSALPPKQITVPLNHGCTFGIIPNVKGPPAKPEKILTAPCTFETLETNKNSYSITIFSNGKIASGTVYLTDKSKKYLGALTCPISQVSWIRVYAYENGQWINK